MSLFSSNVTLKVIFQSYQAGFFSTNGQGMPLLKEFDSSKIPPKILSENSRKIIVPQLYKCLNFIAFHRVILHRIVIFIPPIDLNFRLHSFSDFSGRGILGISIPNSTYSSSSGTEIILFQNKSPTSI